MNKFWFKPKTYGYGAFPITWEGWLLTLGFGVIIVYRALTLKENVNRILIEITIVAVVLAIIAKKENQWQMALALGR